jgi:hypothetical protein
LHRLSFIFLLSQLFLYSSLPLFKSNKKLASLRWVVCPHFVLYYETLWDLKGRKSKIELQKIHRITVKLQITNRVKLAVDTCKSSTSQTSWAPDWPLIFLTVKENPKRIVFQETNTLEFKQFCSGLAWSRDKTQNIQKKAEFCACL